MIPLLLAILCISPIHRLFLKSISNFGLDWYIRIAVLNDKQNIFQQISEVSGNESSTIGHYCGYSKRVKIISASVLEVYFHSDATIKRTGFNASFATVGGNYIYTGILPLLNHLSLSVVY